MHPSRVASFQQSIKTPALAEHLHPISDLKTKKKTEHRVKSVTEVSYTPEHRSSHIWLGFKCANSSFLKQVA